MAHLQCGLPEPELLLGKILARLEGQGAATHKIGMSKKDIAYPNKIPMHASYLKHRTLTQGKTVSSKALEFQCH